MHESSGPKPATMHTQQSGIEWDESLSHQRKGYVVRPIEDKWQYVIYEKTGGPWYADVDCKNNYIGREWQNLNIAFDTPEEAKHCAKFIG